MVQTQISQAPVTATSVTSYETNGIDYEFLSGIFFFSVFLFFLVGRSFIVSLERAPQTSQCSSADPCSVAAPPCSRTVSQPHSCALARQDGVRNR